MIVELFRTEPLPRPKTPQCEAQRTERYWSDDATTDLQCTFQSRYRIDGKHYCARHAGIVALRILIEGQGDAEPKD